MTIFQQPANGVTGANAGKRTEFAGKSRVVLRHPPGVAHFRRSAASGRRRWPWVAPEFFNR